jgi:osmotically-inducible protein OsmY
LLIVCLLLAVAGCKARDGDILRRIVRKTGEKLHVPGNPVGQIAGDVHVPVSKPDLVARVETRLRWDRYLAGARIEVRGDDEGDVVLAGKVADPSVKQRALDLAKSTVGVKRVTDEVKVEKEE